ncbi:MAG: ABC transporter permease, partial [Candidatus Flemingiibacterium sp.]
DAVQEDTLSSYPLTLESNHVDLSSLMQTFIDSAKATEEHEKDAVYQKPALYEMVNAMSNIDARKNDLASFKKYLEAQLGDEESALSSALSGVKYSYDLDLLVYTKNVDGKIVHSDMQDLMTDVMVKYLGSSMAALADSSSQMSSMSSMLGMGSAGTWQEMLPGLDGEVISPIIKKQYDLVYGDWPSEYNEVVLVLDKNNEIADMTLYALGLKSEDDINAIAEAAVSHESIEYGTESWSYEDICNTEYRIILSPDCYQKDESTGLYTDLRESSAGLKYLYDNGIPLKVTGIIRPNEDAVSAMLSGAICYTYKLTDYVVENSKNSDAIKAQLADRNVDIFTGLDFKDGESSSESGKAEVFRRRLEELDTAGKAEMYKSLMCFPSDEILSAQVAQIVGPMTREDIESAIVAAMADQTGMSQDTIASYIAAMSDDELRGYIAESVAEQVKAQYAAQVLTELAAVPEEQLAALLDAKAAGLTDEDCAKYYDEVLTFSDSSYEENLTKLGYVELDNPSAINLYASGFEDKDTVVDAIADYNSSVEEYKKITYTDYIGIMMSSVTTIINAITYVLIAFVAVSLIVSSIMIGVITLISVQERTKEIGILRAIGASKRNVSGMFNAETVIIGFTSGLLGVLITYILCIPINLILHSVTGINNLSAYLPPVYAVILVAISVLLTLIAGIIPSRSAAKKDPVVALRSE